MGAITTSQTLFDGAKYVVQKFTNLSDGLTNEIDVLKVDVSTLNTNEVTIDEIWYDVNGMAVTLLWEATTNVRILELARNGYMCFDDFGGLTNNAGAGKTGNILFTTNGATANSNYSIILKMRKL